MNSILSRVINLLLRRADSVDQIVQSFDKYQAKLVELSGRMREAARVAEERAALLRAEAARKQKEAEDAVTIADRFADLTKRPSNPSE